MGLLDFLKPKKKEPLGIYFSSKGTSSGKKESMKNRSIYSQEVMPEKTRREPFKVTETKELDNSERRESTENRSISSQEIVTIQTTKDFLKVTDTEEVEKNIQLDVQSKEVESVFYCPVRTAKVYCHSVLIDKLGDLTKFIISSMHEGHSIEEISALTQMGNTTVREELDYLIRGGLINDDRETLTDLGQQYGILLGKFSDLSNGIDVCFNVFADKFEPFEDDKYITDPDDKYILQGHFIPTLARNDNYSNSLEIAKNKIELDTPFCREIIKSLYATVKIEKEESKYKPVYVRDYSRGSYSRTDPCVKIAIPCDRVSCRIRYTWVDEYRDVIPQISGMDEKYADLFSDKAMQLINDAIDEENAETITKEINTITGEIIHFGSNLCDLHEDQSVYVLERRPIQLKLDDEVCKGMYLLEINREQLYQIRYFPYDRMEA